MSYWLIPNILDEEAQETALQHDELAIAAAGMPDLSRLQGPDQIAALLRQLHPDMPPESVSQQTDHFWRLGHEILTEDYIVIRTDAGTFMLGEVAGAYRKEGREQGMAHIWPMRWITTDTALLSIPQLSAHRQTTVTEITDEDVLKRLKLFIPGQHKSSATFFKWLGILIMLSELIYFWPKT